MIAIRCTLLITKREREREKLTCSLHYFKVYEYFVIERMKLAKYDHKKHLCRVSSTAIFTYLYNTKPKSGIIYRKTYSGECVLYV